MVVVDLATGSAAGTQDGRDAPVAHLAWVADVHPDHAASQAVARSLGLVASGEVVDGEDRWVSPPSAPA